MQASNGQVEKCSYPYAAKDGTPCKAKSDCILTGFSEIACHSDAGKVVDAVEAVNVVCFNGQCGSPEGPSQFPQPLWPAL